MEVTVNKKGTKGKTDEERKELIKSSKLKYSAKPWTCNKCNVTIRIGNKYNHLKSKKHKKIIEF